MSDILPVIFCPIDTTDIAHAKDLAAAMQKAGCGIKLGLEFFNANGPQGVQEVTAAFPGLKLFIDLKYHDIPNTVAGAVRAITPLAPAYINVHATGGLEMMRAARDACDETAAKAGITAPKILGVTILTSLDESALAASGFRPGMSDRVIDLAQLTRQAGLDGVVCSAHEIEAIRREIGPDFTLMVPGIRPEGSSTDDQKRVMTPSEALEKGASHLVIGRPITRAEDPAAAAAAIMATLDRQAA